MTIRAFGRRRWISGTSDDYGLPGAPLGVMAAAGLRVALFDRPAPTPLAAFAMRVRKAATGVVVAADASTSALSAVSSRTASRPAEMSTICVH